MKTRKADEDLEGTPSPESQRLMEMLQAMARVLGFSNSALARHAKVSLASLNRYFKGDAEPRLDFVLAVVPAIGLGVREFFDLAYPEPEAPSPTRQKIERLFWPILPDKAPRSPRATREPEAAPLRREDVEKMLEGLRRDILHELREMLAEKFP